MPATSKAQTTAAEPRAQRLEAYSEFYNVFVAEQEKHEQYLHLALYIKAFLADYLLACYLQTRLNLPETRLRDPGQTKSGFCIEDDDLVLLLSSTYEVGCVFEEELSFWTERARSIHAVLTAAAQAVESFKSCLDAAKQSQTPDWQSLQAWKKYCNPDTLFEEINNLRKASTSRVERALRKWASGHRSDSATLLQTMMDVLQRLHAQQAVTISILNLLSRNILNRKGRDSARDLSEFLDKQSDAVLSGAFNRCDEHCRAFLRRSSVLAAKKANKEDKRQAASTTNGTKRQDCSPVSHNEEVVYSLKVAACLQRMKEAHNLELYIQANSEGIFGDLQPSSGAPSQWNKQELHNILKRLDGLKNL